jgi:hypothetical protein
MNKTELPRRDPARSRADSLQSREGVKSQEIEESFLSQWQRDKLTRNHQESVDYEE